MGTHSAGASGGSLKARLARLRQQPQAQQAIEPAAPSQKQQ
ncbi:hypothetical protein [Rhabdochromatium marinum]|nr:hypothetical protein [Rhabdochromatium marinum]